MSGEPTPPPPGQLIDVGGFRLHLLCQGAGSPTVVLDAGSGGLSLDWALVMPAIAQRTRVCAYDRAGLGWSDAGPAPRDAQRQVAELRTLLASAGVPPPYVLVGHSSGGLRMQLFALTYPADVAGLVLVDSSVELYAEERLALVPPETRAEFERLLTAAQGNPGAPPPTGLDLAAVVPLIPEDLQPQLAAYVTLIERPSHVRTVADEESAFDASVQQLRAAKAKRDAPPLRNLPLVVLSHGTLGSVTSLAPPPSQLSELRLAIDHAAAAYVASSSTRGELVVAERAGHFIHLDRPDLVASAILTMVNAARDDR